MCGEINFLEGWLGAQDQSSFWFRMIEKLFHAVVVHWLFPHRVCS